MKRRRYLIAVIVYLSLSYLVFLVCDKDTAIHLADEDNLFEWLGAIWFLVSSIFFFVCFLRSKNGYNFWLLKNQRNLFFLIFAFAFFFAFGEEISWGQRVLNFQTPEMFKCINKQNEFNIHNFEMFNKIYLNTVLYKNKDKDLMANGTMLRSLAVLLNFNFLFNLFCLVYCGLFPVLNKFISSFSRLVKKTSLPIVPLWLGIFFVVVVIGSEIIEILVTTELEITAFEMKETNLAFLFMISAIYFAKNLRKRSGSSCSSLQETGRGAPEKRQSDVNEFEADFTSK